MKICKVEIIKKISGGDTKCKNVFPDGYAASKINIICYGDEDWDDGDNASHCIGLVDDDFTFTDKMTECTKAMAEMCISEASQYMYDDMVARGKSTEEAQKAKGDHNSRKGMLPQ